MNAKFFRVQVNVPDPLENNPHHWRVFDYVVKDLFTPVQAEAFAMFHFQRKHPDDYARLMAGPREAGEVRVWELKFEDNYAGHVVEIGG